MAEPSASEPNVALPVSRRSWLRTTVFSVALLLSGAVIGSGVTVMVIHQRFDEARKHPEWLSRRMVDHFREKLDLTDQQTKQIREIFSDTRQRTQALRREQRTEAQAIMQQMHDDVAAVLTPEQREKWDEWFKRVRERAFRRPPEHRRPPPGAPPRPDGAFRQRTPLEAPPPEPQP